MKSKILELAADLAVDDSIRVVCPFCEAKHERSFSIRRTQAGILYHCFRGTCGRNGIVGSVQRGSTSSEKRKTVLRTFQGSLVNIPKGIFDRTLADYGLPLSRYADQGVKYTPELERLYFPIYDARSFQIGENLRSVSKNVKPKALINKWSETVPLIHFPLGQKVEHLLVLTEDQISALKVSEVSPSVSLLGTNLTEEGLRLFHRIGIKHIILMLDGDDAGYKASISLSNKLKSFFRVDQTFLEKGVDPKDLTIEQLKEVLHV